MKISFGKWLPATLVAFVLVSFAMTAYDAAARGGGGGGGGRGGGGGGAHGSVGAGRGAQVNDGRADVRTNDVRNTSVNNVNVERNVNVNVNRGGWDNVNHPIAAAKVIGAAVGATPVVVGTVVSTMPPWCVPVNYADMVYLQCESGWYQYYPQGSQYVVVNPPY